MEYYFNELSPTTFQRLINALLLNRFGEYIRLTPLRGSDGGRDAESLPDTPLFQFNVLNDTSQESSAPIKKGKYLFQVKHHRTTDNKISEVRRIVLNDFEEEVKANVLSRAPNDAIDFFYLITNVPCSEDALIKLDRKRTELFESHSLIRADIWWQEQIIAFLDRMPVIWSSFPEIFAGRKVPLLAAVTEQSGTGLPRTVRLAIDKQYRRDSHVKFLEIGFEKDLAKIFVDLDVSLANLNDKDRTQLLTTERVRLHRNRVIDQQTTEDERYFITAHDVIPMSALNLLLNETAHCAKKLILEGGPGQGKSTLTQMATQVYRHQLLLKDKLELSAEKRWETPKKARLPFRIELRLFAEWLSNNYEEASVEQYLAQTIKRDSGGGDITVEDIHTMFELTPAFIVFDGLDEVGSDDLRDTVLGKISDFVYRLESSLKSDLKVIVTTRPPAIAGRREKLADFKQFPINPLEGAGIKTYVERWLKVQLEEEEEKSRIRSLFESRQKDPYVQALARNPMQLAVLLNFIRLTSDAFPDKRAELYRDYFKIIIDRDVTKFEPFRKNREVIESLHRYLGFKIHLLTEAQQADGTLDRQQLLSMVQAWLDWQSNDEISAAFLFGLGQERLGLIVTAKGEGTNERYGFAIQPIREYFAAAFINEHLSQAHDIFQDMVRRPYWREVALFLAGLRRSIEKADLIARAKLLDNDELLGWRQHGKIIVLQLLQEGVFAQPTHVLSDALDFVIDLLDIDRVPLQVEPRELYEILPEVIRRSKDKASRMRLIQLAKKHINNNDQNISHRILRILARVPEASHEVKEIVFDNRAHPFLIAKRRILWASQHIPNWYELSSEQAFWEGSSDIIWAFHIWNNALRDVETLKLQVPERMHYLLLEQFAVNPRSIWNRRTVRSELNFFPEVDLGTKQLAVWRIFSLCKAILFMTEIHQLEMGQNNSKLKERVIHLVNEPWSLNWAGLPESAKTLLISLEDVLLIVLKAALQSPESAIKAVNDHIEIVERHLNLPGILGLVACRCASTLLRFTWAAELGIPKIYTIPREELLILIKSSTVLFRLWTATTPFYSNNNEIGSKPSVEHKDLAASMVIPGFTSPISDTPPLWYRIHEGGDFYSIIERIANGASSELLPSEDWVERVVLTGRHMRSIFSLSKNLEGLFYYISEYHWVDVGYGPPLRVAEMQRILKVARDSNNTSVLSGVLKALMTSRFIKLAGDELVVKLLANSNDPILVTSTLFNRRHHLEGDAEQAELEILDRIASKGLAHPEMAFSARLIMADYLVDRLSLNLPPLLTEANHLGLGSL